MASLSEVLDELEELKERAEELLKKAEDLEPPSLITRGDAISEFAFSLEDKLRLDRIRERVVSTISGHHYYKSIASLDSKLVDWIEELLECCEREGVEERVWSLVRREVIKRPRDLEIEHETPRGEVIVLRGRIVEERGGALIARRVFRSPGKLDGLGVEKKPGDYSLTAIVLGSRLLPHLYYSRGGELLGAYVNVNSPIELKSSGSLWYVDYGVDVVSRKDGSAEVLDLQDLEECEKRDMLSADFCRELAELAREIAEDLGGEPPTLERLVDLALKYRVLPYGRRAP